MDGLNLAKSRPPRGAWIEIVKRILSNERYVGSRPPRGAWIEIASSCSIRHGMYRRAPHGARGLKLPYAAVVAALDTVAPPTGRVD